MAVLFITMGHHYEVNISFIVFKRNDALLKKIKEHSNDKIIHSVAQRNECEYKWPLTDLL